MKKRISVRLGLSIFLVLLAVLSFTVVSGYTSSPEAHKKDIEFLDEEKETALAFTGAAGAASLVVSALPGDTGTPISNNLSTITIFFGISLAAIFLEKYLLTLTGFFTFGVLIPIALILLVIYLYVKSPWLRIVSGRLIAIGLAIFLAVPLSVHVSKIIKDTYQTSIDESFAKIENNIEAMEKAANEENQSEETDENAEEEITEETDADKSFLKGVTDTIGGAAATVKDAAGSAVETVTNAATTAYEYAKTAINAFIEGVAVMLVITCLIPLFTLIVLVWAVKMICGVNVNLSTETGETMRRIGSLHAGIASRRKPKRMKTEQQPKIETKEEQ